MAASSGAAQAVAASSSPAAAASRATPSLKGGRFPPAQGAPKSRVHVHREAADWEPVSVTLRPGSGPGRTSFERRVRRLNGGEYRGQPSPAQAAARVHPAQDDRWLIVSVYPAVLRLKRTHLEARFLIQEGYLEEVKIAAVSVAGGANLPDDEKEDSISLRDKGVDFSEQFPGGAEVELSLIDPGPGRAANAGQVRHAFFGEPALGFVNFSWSVTGVSGAKPARR